MRLNDLFLISGENLSRRFRHNGPCVGDRRLLRIQEKGPDAGDGVGCAQKRHICLSVREGRGGGGGKHFPVGVERGADNRFCFCAVRELRGDIHPGAGAHCRELFLGKGEFAEAGQNEVGIGFAALPGEVWMDIRIR